MHRCLHLCVCVRACISAHAAATTVPGAQTSTRFTRGFLARMGMTDLIARTEEEYVRKALALGTNPRARACAGASDRAAAALTRSPVCPPQRRGIVRERMAAARSKVVGENAEPVRDWLQFFRAARRLARGEEWPGHPAHARQR